MTYETRQLLEEAANILASVETGVDKRIEVLDTMIAKLELRAATRTQALTDTFERRTGKSVFLRIEDEVSDIWMAIEDIEAIIAAKLQVDVDDVLDALQTAECSAPEDLSTLTLGAASDRADKVADILRDRIMHTEYFDESDNDHLHALQSMLEDAEDCSSLLDDYRWLAVGS